MSSADKWTLKESHLIRLENGCMYGTNKIGPAEHHKEVFVRKMRFAVTTDCLLFDKYEQNHDRHVPEIPYK